MIIWNLNEYPPEIIKAIEDEVIETIYPYCNQETSNLRNKLNKLFLETHNIIKKYDIYDKKLQIFSACFQKGILNNEGKKISQKIINKKRYTRQYFIENRNKYSRVLSDLFNEWDTIIK